VRRDDDRTQRKSHDHPESREDPGGHAVDRRRFVTLLGQVWLAVPAASWLLAGCGGEDEAGNQQAMNGSRSGGADGYGPNGVGNGSADRAADSPSRMDQAESAATGDSGMADVSETPSGSSAAGSSSDEQLVTEIPAMSALVNSVNYQHQTPKPDQRCDNCQLYTAKTDTLGKCQLFTQGLVEAEGWCTSWIKKANAA